MTGIASERESTFPQAVPGAVAEDPLIQVRGLTRYFDPGDQGLIARLFSGGHRLHAVDHVNLDIRRNRVLGLVGESGCGKSTMGRLLSLLLDPTAGSIRYEGQELVGISGGKLKKIRPQIQLVFQDPFSSLNPRKRVVDIVGRPLETYFGLRGRAKLQKVVDLLDQVGLRTEYAFRYPHEFSGGQRQRIAIARALATEPNFLIADEPVSALDVSVQAQILGLLERLHRDRHFTMVFISHDLNVIEYIADDVAVMYAGQIVEHGEADAVFGNPKHPYTRALLESNPDPQRRRPLAVLKGEPMVPVNPKPGCRFAIRCPMRIDDCEREDPPLEEKAPAHRAACIRV